MTKMYLTTWMYSSIIINIINTSSIFMMSMNACFGLIISNSDTL